MTEHKTRAQILEIAKSWIGTPYRHQAMLKGVGCDCLGLLRGIWEEVYQQTSPTPPPYTPFWAEVNTRGEPMKEAADRYLVQLPSAEKRSSSDVGLVRIRKRSAIKHCFILVSRNPDMILHAYSGHAVQINAMPPQWMDKEMHWYTWPGVID